MNLLPSRAGIKAAHVFPKFYACYLLKSIQTPQSKEIYIGSTPSPPRRIRQHNGEIASGAKKTRLKRPWVMQMIVYGFPSRLAALQFEWAWQHPHISRHLRHGTFKLFGERASKTFKKNIAIVRTMIAKHPFNTWPLHVKLFTEAAVQHWQTASSSADADLFPLPPGFTYTIELEGVDGLSGPTGSGRTGPISVSDEEFTVPYISKNTTLLESNSSFTCSICSKHIDDYTTDPLTTSLCPSGDCTSVSHLLCLSKEFLRQSPETTTFLPRGGHCSSCQNYILWGDIIRGCYRRKAAMLGPDGLPEPDGDDLYASEEDSIGGAVPETPKRVVKKRKSTSKSRSSRSVSPDETRPSPKNKKPKPKSLSSKAKGKARAITPVNVSSFTERDPEQEVIDLTRASDSDVEDSGSVNLKLNVTPVIVKRKRGRPHKDSVSDSDILPPPPPDPSLLGTTSLLSSIVIGDSPTSLYSSNSPIPGSSSKTYHTTTSPSPPRTPSRKTNFKTKTKAQTKKQRSSSSSGEFFDFTGLTNSGSDVTDEDEGGVSTMIKDFKKKLKTPVFKGTTPSIMKLNTSTNRSGAVVNVTSNLYDSDSPSASEGGDTAADDIELTKAMVNITIRERQKPGRRKGKHPASATEVIELSD